MGCLRLLELLCCIASVWAVGPYPDIPISPIQVVPYPQVVTPHVEDDLVQVNLEVFRFTCNVETELLVRAFDKYEKYFRMNKFRSKVQGSAVLNVLNVAVLNPEAPLTVGVDESYQLSVRSSPKGIALAQLKAPNQFGVIRGLETFYQMYNWTDGSVPTVDISDWPRFQYRGLLIDTSRHYLTVPVIKQVLDAMSWIKLNVLHWHIVDDPSFPYYSRLYPEMAEAGAYDSNHVYTQGDVASVIRHAALLGITVIPEFDTPGHVLSWGKTKPGFLTHCPGKGTFYGDYGPIDPTVEDNYSFLKSLFAEIVEVFPSQYIHLGGDEVPFGCWQSNANITEWMKENGIAGKYKLLEQYYENRLLEMVGAMNHSYVVWQEIFTNGLKIKPDTIIHLWVGNWTELLNKVTGQGFRAILSSPWYLNYISFGRDWKKYYEVEPLNFNGTAAQKELVLGGEACMWGEYVDDTNVLSRTFPRAGAVAERLWSKETQRDEKDAEFRIDMLRCSMTLRGVPAETIVTRGYCPVEYEGY